jgi:hypothetical protein
LVNYVFLEKMQGPIASPSETVLYATEVVEFLWQGLDLLI